MKILILLWITLTTTSATFYNIKPHKLYKHLVEPLVDVAVRSIISGSVIEPIGHHFFGGGGGGRYSKHHHKKKHHQNQRYPVPIPYTPREPYHQPYQPNYYHERDILLNYDGHAGYPGFEHYGHGGQEYGGFRPDAGEGLFYPLQGEQFPYEGFGR